jgi:hypothetical protein
MSSPDSQILYALENNLLSIKGELLHEIGMDRRLETTINTRASSSPSRHLYPPSRHHHRGHGDVEDDDDDDVEEMIQEGKRWRHFEVSSTVQ